MNLKKKKESNVLAYSFMVKTLMYIAHCSENSSLVIFTLRQLYEKFSTCK